MKILYVLDQFVLGGAEKIAMLEANAFSKCIDTTLLISNNFEDAQKYASCKLYNIKRIKRFDFHYIIELRKYILEQKFTHIHFHSAISSFHFVFTLLWLSKIKTFLTHHGFIDKKNPKGHFDIKLYLINKFSSWFVNSNLAVSSYQLNDLNKYGIKRLRLLYNFVDEKFCYLNRQKTLFNKEKIICGLTGNINKVRDHITVIRACKLLINRGYNIEIWFAGKGVIGKDEVLDEIGSQNLESRIRLLGMVDNIPKFLSEIDIFIASSRYETFGVGMVEALAVGLPTLASDIPVYKEITNNGEYAYLFKCGDEFDLVDKFENMIKDQYYLNNIGNISHVVKNKFSLNSHIENLMEIYNT